MEIFQTIWTALTTENELLSKILLIPVGFIEITVQVLLFTTLLNIKTTKKQICKYIIIFSIISNLINIFIINPYKSIVSLVLMLTLIKLFFKTNIIKTILALLLPVIFSIISESIIITISLNYFNFDASSLAALPIYRFILTLCIQLLIFIDKIFKNTNKYF